MSNDVWLQRFLAVVLVLFGVAVTTVLFAAPVLGFGDWRVAKEILDDWDAMFTLVIGGVVGHYFPRRQNEVTPI